jgi:hypothetical protein
MLSIVALVAFAGFLALASIVAVSRRLGVAPSARRFVTNAMIAYALAASSFAGISQHDMWPFSSWTMMVGLTPPATRVIPTLRVMGVDSEGCESDIDFRAWQPLSMEELYSWLQRDFFRLEPASRDRVGVYLLQSINRARTEVLNSSGLAWSSPVLGPLSAPTHLLHPAIWAQRNAVPKNPFVSVRIYKEAWDLQATTGVSTSRVLAYEYPRL